MPACCIPSTAHRSARRSGCPIRYRSPAVDRWTAWELTWLDPSGRAQVAIATFDVPCTSPRIVESKSVKLWLASLYNERFDSAAAVRDLLVPRLVESDWCNRRGAA